MAKYTQNDVPSGYTATQVNDELTKIESAIDDHLDRKGGPGNQMEADLDMNSNDILNVKGIGVQSMSIAGQQVTATDLATTTLPASTGNEGAHLVTDGTTASWERAYKSYGTLADVVADTGLKVGDYGKVVAGGDFEIVDLNPDGYYVASANGFIKPIVNEDVGFSSTLSALDAEPFVALGDTVRIEDRGGELFSIVEGETANGLDIIDLTASGLQAKLIYKSPLNILAFGAKPDSGTTDNASAIQRAIDVANSGGYRAVVIPASSGYYSFSSDIYLKSRVFLFGLGFGAELRGNGAALKVDGANEGAHVTDWGMVDFEINRSGAAGPALHLTGDGTTGSNKGAIRFTIKDVRTNSSSGDGWIVENTFIGCVYNPLIRGCSGTGLRIRKDVISGTVGCNTVSFYGGEIQQCNQGFAFDTLSGVNFYGTAVEGNSTASLVGENSRNLGWYGGYFELNGSASGNRDIIIGDSGTSPVGIVFNNVVFWDGAGAVKDHAIELVKVQNLAVENCTFNSYATSGILNTGGGSAVQGFVENARLNSTPSQITNETPSFQRKLKEQIITHSTTIDFPSIAAGSQNTQTVTVTGAVAGDFIEVATTSNLQGMTMTANCRAADTVDVTISNNTGSAIDLPNATYRILVKPRSYWF